MFAFRIFVSTLVLVMICLLSMAAAKINSQSGKKVALAVIILYGLCLVAIWG